MCPVCQHYRMCSLSVDMKYYKSHPAGKRTVTVLSYLVKDMVVGGCGWESSSGWLIFPPNHFKTLPWKCHLSGLFIRMSLQVKGKMLLVGSSQRKSGLWPLHSYAVVLNKDVCWGDKEKADRHTDRKLGWVDSVLCKRNPGTTAEPLSVCYVGIEQRGDCYTQLNKEGFS